MSEPIPTPEGLTALCREWQERLRLQDWRVRVVLGEPGEMDGDAGSCSYNIELKSAVIRVNPFRSKATTAAWCPDEVTVIHELLHLPLSYLWEWKRDTAEHQLAEQFIENTAWGLYRAKHGDKVRDDFVEA